MNLLNSIARLLSRMPPEGYAALSKLVNALLSSDDPLEATRRAAMVVGSRKASEEVLKKLLGRSK